MNRNYIDEVNSCQAFFVNWNVEREKFEKLTFEKLEVKYQKLVEFEEILLDSYRKATDGKVFDANHATLNALSDNRKKMEMILEVLEKESDRASLYVLVKKKRVK